MPDLNPVRHDEHAQGDGSCDLHHLRRDQDHAFVVPIRGRTADHRECKCRNTGGKIDHAKHERLVRERAHHPALRHYLHPGAGIRNC